MQYVKQEKAEEIDTNCTVKLYLVECRNEEIAFPHIVTILLSFYHKVNAIKSP